MLCTVCNTQRGSQSYIEKRRGRKEIEVTKKRTWGVKRQEADLASDHFPKCSPQLRKPRETHRVKWRKEGEEGDRGDLREKRECQKGIEQSSQ